MKSVLGITCLLALSVVIATVLGCGEDIVPITAGPGETPATLEGRIERNNEFAFKLYRELGSSEDNLIISPHSIVTAFGMAYAGARGTTEQQISNVLCFNYPQAGFHSALRQLNNRLLSLEGLEFNIANGCWGRDDMTYLSSFLDTLSVNYGADIENMDFVNHPEESLEAINQWAEDQTRGLVSGLLPPGSIDALTYLVLANAVYFSAEWLYKFDPEYTDDRSFTRLDGSKITVPMMYGEAGFPYYEGNGYRAIEFFYKGEATSMVVILPDEGQFATIEDSFNVDMLDTVVDGLEMTVLKPRFPKFSFFSDFDLVSCLKAMGMKDAFAPGADFSGMDGTDDGTPWISAVAHKAFISVDEYGTLAAAGTGMIFSVGMFDSFDAVRPFIFVIRDIETGTILFLGRVLDPTA